MSTQSHDGRANEPCAEYESLILRSVDGVLDPPNQSRLTAHLVGCAACRAAMQDQRAMATLVAAAFEVDPPRGLSTRVLAGLEETGSWLDWLDFRGWTWRVSPVAAALALVAWLVVSFTQTATAREATADLVGDSSQAEALSWDDVVNEGDLVSLIWQTEVASEPMSTSEEIEQ